MAGRNESIDDEEEEEFEDDLLDCLMCRNETLVDFLRKHIRFHHMIEEDGIVEKLFNMHFHSEAISIETQTQTRTLNHFLQVTWVTDMNTLGERLDRLDANCEVPEVKPDVSMLEGGRKVESGEKEKRAEDRRPQRREQFGTTRQDKTREEPEIPPEEGEEDGLALTSGKLKLKIKTEGGKRFSKVIREDKENINLKEKQALINGEPVLPSERVRLDSVVVTPLSTSERAIDALRRQQNKTPSCTTNSEADSGPHKEEAEHSSEVGCDLFSEPDEFEKLSKVQPPVNIPGVKDKLKMHKPHPPVRDLIKKEDILAKIEGASRSIPSEQKTVSLLSKQTQESVKKKKCRVLGPRSRRRRLRLESSGSDSGTSNWTNGHLEEEDTPDVDDNPPDPDDFPNPDRGSWLPDNKQFSRIIRYKCPYCSIVETKRHVVDDHIIIEHSIQGTSKMVPKYGEATKQEMFLMIERDPRLITKYHEDILFCEENNMSILEEVCEGEVILKEPDSSPVKDTSLNSSSSSMEEVPGQEAEWHPCDATLPEGWQFREVRLQNGSTRKAYLSSCGKRLNSRDTVTEFLLGQGLDVMHPSGFNQTFCMPGLETECPGLCEGDCPALTIDQAFYSPTDPNRTRKQTKIKFALDVNGPRMKDMKREKVSNSAADKGSEEEVKAYRYGIPLIRAERPWIIFIDERSEEEKKYAAMLEERRRDESVKTPIKRERLFSDPEEEEFNMPNVSFDSTENDDKDAVSKIIEGLKSPIKDKKRKLSGSEEKGSMKKRRGSVKTQSPEEDMSFQTLRGGQQPTRKQISHRGQGGSHGGSHGGRASVSPLPTERQAALAEKEKKMSKERSYLKGIERKTRADSEEFQDAADNPKSNRLGLIGYGLIYDDDDDAKKSSHTVSSNLGTNLRQPAQGMTTQELKKRKNVEVLKKLQKQDLEENRTGGTYVQCCNEKCAKWRLVAEYVEAEQVPDHWVCKMIGEKCGVGGHDFMSDRDLLDIKFTCGSMVWAKLKGFPWWPGMVDYCPDSQEYYWIEEDVSITEPTWYNVVYFEGRGDEVSRAWVETSNIVRMTLPVEPPKSLKALKTGPLKNRLGNAINMASEAKAMRKADRLEKYSFATLFKGKWGTHPNSEEEDEAKNKSKKTKSQNQPTQKPLSESVPDPVPKKKKRTKTTPKILRPDIFSEDDDDEENFTDVSTFKHKTKKNGHGNHKIKQPLDSSSSDEGNTDVGQSADLFKSSSKACNDDDDSNDEDNEDKLAAALKYQLPNVYEVGRKGGLPLPIKRIKKEPIITEIKLDIDSIKPEHGEPSERNHPRPSLPSDVLIALAVRNLDPSNQLGASFTSIIAFLSLHFPYFNRRLEECRDMVKKAYDMDEDDETGRENFRIKGALVERLAGRIKSYVVRHRVAVRASMLVPDFLDTMVERFANLTHNNPAAKVRPPYSCKMLAYLALLSVCPPASMDQIMIFLTFLFPSLASSDSSAFTVADFERSLQEDEFIEEMYGPRGNRLYSLIDGSYPAVGHRVRQFFSTKSNNVRLNKSIYKPDFVNILLPNLTN